MVGEVKYLRTEQALWRIERVVDWRGQRVWRVGRWITDEDSVEQLIETGDFRTWKRAIEVIMALEEQWHKRQEQAKAGETERRERDAEWLASEGGMR